MKPPLFPSEVAPFRTKSGPTVALRRHDRFRILTPDVSGTPQKLQFASPTNAADMPNINCVPCAARISGWSFPGGKHEVICVAAKDVLHILAHLRRKPLRVFQIV